MEPAIAKWLKAILSEIQSDIKNLQNFREQDLSEIRKRLNNLERQVAVVETKTKMLSTFWGAAAGLFFGVIAEIISKNYL